MVFMRMDCIRFGVGFGGFYGDGHGRDMFPTFSIFFFLLLKEKKIKTRTSRGTKNFCTHIDSEASSAPAI